MSRLFGRFIFVLFLTLLLLFSSLVPHILHAQILNFLTRKSISNQQQAVYEFFKATSTIHSHYDDENDYSSTDTQVTIIISCNLSLEKDKTRFMYVCACVCVWFCLVERLAFVFVTRQ